MNNIEFIDGMNKAWDLAFRLIGEDKDVLLKMFGTDEVDEIISNNEPQYVLKKLEGYDNENRKEYVPGTNVGNKDGKTLTEQECFDEEGEEMLLIEDVLDTLIEVGNGVTDEALHESADKLFRVRDILNSKANDDGWIPVEERLPEDKQQVLVTNWDHSVFPARYDENGKRFVDIRNSFTLPLIFAWMPLPKPYREKGE